MQIFGHRGVRAGALPENSMVAFTRAVEGGADGIELDVRTSKCGTPIVLHDPDLARVAGDPRKAEALDLRALRTVRLTGGAEIPTLAEVLDWATPRSILVNVELKHDTHDRAALARGVARLVAGRPIAARVIFSSFQPELLARIGAAQPAIPRALLIHRGQRAAHTQAADLVAKALFSTAIHAEAELATAARIARWQARGFLVRAWTVNDPAIAARLAHDGIDALITDRPAEIRSALADRSAGG
jgi:glycerophosphoryl diester phosphodiesterase